MILDIQSKLFPGGKLPAQRPIVGSTSHHNSIGQNRERSLSSIEPSMEPKMDSQQEATQKLLAASSAIVKSRTEIKQLNKRPPSKVVLFWNTVISTSITLKLRILLQ